MDKRKVMPLFSWENFGALSRFVSIRVSYGEIAPGPGYLRTHYHSYYCGFYVTEGEYEVEFENETVSMSKNHCILIRPEVSHRVKRGASACGYALAVNQELLLDTFLLHMTQNKVFSDFFYNQFIEKAGSTYYIRLQDREPEETVQVLQGITQELKTQDGFTRDLAEIRFVIFLAQLARSAHPATEAKEEQAGEEQAAKGPAEEAQENGMAKGITRILWYIREHSASATLQSTAKYFHYNASYLSRLLTQETGKSFRDWQKKFRLEKAAFLLETRDYSVQAVAQLTGYSNVGSFYQAFQAGYRMTPSQYRARNKKG